MVDLSAFPVLLATVVAIAFSGAYYSALGARMAKLSPAYAEPDRSAVATLGVELVRTLLVAVVLAGLASSLALDRLAQALAFALVLWVAFPVVLLSGSVFHERVPPMLAAIHAGDWLVKLAVISSIVTVWQ